MGSLMLFLVIPIMFRFYFSIHIFFAIFNSTFGTTIPIYAFLLCIKTLQYHQFYFTLFYASYTLFLIPHICEFLKCKNVANQFLKKYYFDSILSMTMTTSMNL